MRNILVCSCSCSLPLVSTTTFPALLCAKHIFHFRFHSGPENEPSQAKPESSHIEANRIEASQGKASPCCFIISACCSMPFLSDGYVYVPCVPATLLLLPAAVVVAVNLQHFILPTCSIYIRIHIHTYVCIHKHRYVYLYVHALSPSLSLWVCVCVCLFVLTIKVSHTHTQTRTHASIMLSVYPCVCLCVCAYYSCMYSPSYFRASFYTLQQ